MMFRTRWIAGVALSAGVLLAAGETAISPDSMREWLTYLSSDDLEGRQVFTEGLGLAAAYIADELKAFGVKPGGDHGTYFQRVEVLGVKKTDRSTLTVEVNGVTKTFKGGEGITFPANLGAKRTLAIDDVQFIGYGINLGPDHNDYRDASLKGKAAIWLGANGPKGTDQQQARRRLNARASYATEEMGALATIAPPNPPGGRGGGGGGGNAGGAGQQQPPQQPQAQPPATPAAGGAAGAGAAGAGGGGRGRGNPAPQPDFTTTQRLDRILAPSVTATDDFFEFLFSASDVKYADLKALVEQQAELPHFQLKGVKLTFNIDADYQAVQTRYTRNVVGLLEGNDARLKDTYVAFGAHYDHNGYNQGILPEGETDRINNGADDDGSGSTTLLALARSFAGGAKTKRSLMFVWHAGEEAGLYGSRYYADYPTIPLDKIAAQLNIDMVGRNDQNKDELENSLFPVGADRISTELHNILIDANQSLAKPMTLDFSLNDLTDPERIYYRSDHYSYASKGIPIIFFTTGLHPDYHRVTDSVEKIHFDKMANIGRLIEETGRRVANLDHVPARDFKGPRTGKTVGGKLP